MIKAAVEAGNPLSPAPLRSRATRALWPGCGEILEIHSRHTVRHVDSFLYERGETAYADWMDLQMPTGLSVLSSSVQAAMDASSAKITALARRLLPTERKRLLDPSFYL